MSEKIREEVDAYLKQMSNGFLTFNAWHRGTGKTDNWEHDIWHIEFFRPGNGGKGLKFETEFKTGMGWRETRRNANYAFRATYPNGKPKAPTATDVLHSVLLDARAIDMSFNDWCWELGFNNDSINDFETYRECCKIGEKVRNFFTHEERTTLTKMLEEY